MITVKTLASGNATPAEGDIVTFQIDVTNDGGAQATNVSLIDSLPAGITFTGSTTTAGTTYDQATGVFDIGTLNVGQTATLTLSGTVDAGQGGNTITNITTAATGDQIDPSTVGDDLEEAVDVVDNTTDLVTVKTLASGNTTPDEGDIVTFDITVTNDGPGIATNVSLTDLLPPGLTATGNNGGITQGAYNDITGLFDIGTLLVGQTATLTLEGIVDAGQAGNTITNITTAATGDQVDPSTAGDDLEEAVVVGVPAADLVTVKTLASGDGTPDEGDTVIFQITVTNDGPDTATGVSLTDSLPAGLTFVADTTSQGSYDPATGLFDIGTLASGATATLTLEGTVDVGQGGNTITNITTAATGDQVDPSTAGDDLDESVVVNAPTPVGIADISVAKSVVGTPVLNNNGFHIATFEVVVENTGSVDLTSVSLVEDIASQFGPAFVDAGNLTLVSGTTDPLSSIQLNNGFDGNLSTDFLDNSGTNRLQVGDSFTVTFDVEIDSRQANGILVNQVTAIGNAIDSNGNLITDSNGVVTASDFSDSGTDTGSTNPGQPGDTGSPDDPTPVDLPAIPTGSISGTVFNDTSGDGIQQLGEVGIPGVLITLSGTDVFGDPVTLTVLTDANGNYSFDGLNAGDYTITQTQPQGFIDGIDTGDPSFTVGNDEFSNISLGFGQSFTGNTFAELQGSGTGSTTPGFPPNLPSFSTFTNLSVSTLLTGFTGSPGPIYSGIPINANANPLSLESGQAVAGGYNVNNAISDPGTPVEVEPNYCEVPVDACDPYNSAVPVEQPVQQIIVDECGCGPVLPVAPCHGGEVISEGQVIEAPIENQQIEVPNAETLGAPISISEPSFLKRFTNWLSHSDNA